MPVELIRHPDHPDWLGVEVHDQATADERIPVLLATEAKVRLMRMVLTGPVDLRSEWTGIRSEGQWMNVVELGHGLVYWVTVAGQVGPDAKPLYPDWVRSIRDQCQSAGVPFNFEGWGRWVPLAEMRSDSAVQVVRAVFPDGRHMNDNQAFGDGSNGVGSVRMAMLVDCHFTTRTLDGVFHDASPESIFAPTGAPDAD